MAIMAKISCCAYYTDAGSQGRGPNKEQGAVMRNAKQDMYDILLPVLDETDGGGLFAEALTAEIKAVFANKASLVSTQPALAAPFSVFSRTRKPNGVVGHVVGLKEA